MRILSVSDKVEPVLYGPYIRERVGKIDLILGCGDLPNYYLEYIVGLLDAPLCFVHGNHDRPGPFEECDESHRRPPTDFAAWGTNLHARCVNHWGLLVAGLEGCRRYQPAAPFQYSEPEMKRQVLALARHLLSNRMRHGRYLDVLITHAPPRGIHDGEDLPHRGFEIYLPLLRMCRPLLLIHGHQHIYDRNTTSESTYRDTRIVNTYGYRVLELAPLRDSPGWQLVSRSR